MTAEVTPEGIGHVFGEFRALTGDRSGERRENT